MTKFNHVDMSWFPMADLKTKNIDGNRFYVTPKGYYPSITTVLSDRNKKGLFEWRKRVGEDVANHIARKAASRGTKVHHMCEDYLNNKDISHHKKDFLPWCLFNEMKDKLLCNINNIHAQECGLYSDKYRVAGRTDCIAEYNGELSIIDFKTSTSERTDSWNENYYIQGAAYAEMFGERAGILVDQVVILVVTEDGTTQEFIKKKHDYLPMLTESIHRWEEKNEIPNFNIDNDIGVATA